MREMSEKPWKSARVLLFLCLCISALRPSSVSGATDPSDVSALKVMFSSMNSPQQLTGWSQNGDDPCGQSWKGVKCSGQRVTEIKLSNLQLSGSYGFQMESLKSLTILDLSNNNLGGTLPYGMPPNLKRLNLGRNNFNGDVPYSISTLKSLEYLNISHNQLQNQLNDMFGQLTSLSTLDLSFNTIAGNLPRSFSSLSNINSMYLQNNQFTGPIDVLAALPLEKLNVENNHFTGWIPETLKHINFKNSGNTWNSGPAPPPPPGTPPITRNRNRNGGSGDTSSNGSGDGGKSSGIGGGGIAGIVISILVVAGIIAFFIVKKRSKRPSADIEKLENEPFEPLASKETHEMKAVQTSTIPPTKTFDVPATETIKPPPIERNKSFGTVDFVKKAVESQKTVTLPSNLTAFTVADLQMATGSFSVENRLGEGSFGRIYRAQFDDRKVLAITKLDSDYLFFGHKKTDKFLKLVSDISNLHHPNITELVGYCSEHEQFLLAYEYHENGTLSDYLHLSDEYSKPLIWNTRVKIALATARALEYLHEGCSPSVVHKNVCSVNIVLDAELNPHLSDCGLANFLPGGAEYLQSHKNFGYDGPEIAMSNNYSVKSDVYSFGIIMLELLTGRKPFDSKRQRSEQILVSWALPQLHDIDALSKMVDPALEGLYPVKSVSRFADVIALCIQGEPEFRPPMSEVVQALVRLVQRANMSKRTTGGGGAVDQGTSKRGDDGDEQEL